MGCLAGSVTGRPARDLRSKTRTVPEPRLKARERGGSQKRPWQPKQRRARSEKRRFGPKECELGPEQSERGRQKISAGPPSLFSEPDSLFYGPPKSEFAREKCWRAPREIFWECAGNCWHNPLAHSARHAFCSGMDTETRVSQIVRLLARAIRSSRSPIAPCDRLLAVLLELMRGRQLARRAAFKR